jgi:hypothetical protein
MAWGVGAKQVWTDLISQLREEPDDLRRNLFARVGEITIRIATIIAFGRGSLTVDQTDMEWARALTLESAESLHRDVLKYTVDMQDFPGLCQKILKLIAANGGWMSKRDLRRGCQNLLKKGGDLDAAIEYLKGAERIRDENPIDGWTTIARLCNLRMSWPEGGLLALLALLALDPPCDPGRPLMNEFSRRL